MKVYLDDFTLSAGGQESPIGWQIEGRRTVQVASFLRAANAEVFARGSRVLTVTFAVTREHASQGAAESFLFTHAATLPAGGTATFLCEDVDGPQVGYTAQAAVQSDAGTQTGIHTTHRYTLVCGAVSGGELE